MSSIQEAANILTPVLDAREPDSIVNLLQVVAARVSTEQELVAQATEGSDAPETAALQDVLAQIAHNIGELATAATAATSVKEALLARWGLLPAGAAAAQPTVGSVDQPTVRPEKDKTKESLGTPLTENIESMGPVKLDYLACRGVHTYRDAIVAGRAYMTDTDKIGSYTAGNITKHIAKVTEETVQDVAEFSDVLRVCPTLRDVSWAALQASYITADQAWGLGWRNKRVTIQDLITLPEKVIVVPDEKHISNKSEMARAVAGYNRLVRDARKFADKFQKAKGQQQ